MKNPILKLVGILIVVSATLFFSRDAIIRSSIGSVCRAATGLELKIGHFSSNLSLSKISIRDLKLFNPPSFSEKIMFFLPEVRVDADLGSIISGKPHLKEVYLHVGELVIEKNKEGKLNLSELKPSKTKQKTTDSKPTPKIQIDSLRLKIDKVLYKDFSKPIPLVKEFNLQIDETFRDVQDVRAITPIIIGHVLRNSVLSGLLDFKVGDLLQNFQAGGVQIADLGLDKISDIFNSGVTNTAKDVVGGVADQLGSIFGIKK